MIGENIKKLRVQMNITQDALAETLNVTRQAVSKWENNNGEPDLGMLQRIAEALNTTLEELLYGDCSVQILSISKEKLPAVRLVGKRYSGNENFHAKWRQWQTNGLFSALEQSNSPYSSCCVGAKRIVNGGLEYWIGMLFLPDIPVPAGFEFADIASVDLANLRLRGKAYQLSSFDTHNRCLAELSAHEMTRFEDHWCFECFEKHMVGLAYTEKMVEMEYKIAIL